VLTVYFPNIHSVLLLEEPAGSNHNILQRAMTILSQDAEENHGRLKKVAFSNSSRLYMKGV
jgi:hypothetical protein